MLVCILLLVIQLMLINGDLDVDQVKQNQRDLVDKINDNKGSSFTAQHYEHLDEIIAKRIEHRRNNPQPSFINYELGRQKRAAQPEGGFGNVSAPPPNSFDPTTKWPKCKSNLLFNMDEGDCKASWAIASTSMMSDRRCILYGTPQVRLSAWEMLSCSPHTINVDRSKRCEYDQVNYPAIYEFYNQAGVVTGAGYKGNGCKPYPMGLGKGSNDSTCNKVCQPSYKAFNYYHDRRKGGPMIYYDNDTDSVMREMVARGPVISLMFAYKDFYAYKSGVYTVTPGNDNGIVDLRYVKLIGWGVTADGVKYWKGVNSLGATWGENGTFRILRGTNEAEVEIGISTAVALRT